MMSETIFATATAPGKSGVSIIRISGPNALTVLGRFTSYDNSTTIEANRAYYTKFSSPDDASETIDKGYFIFFKSPNSFTGEDVVELHVHGSPAVVRSILGHLSKLGSCRIAKPGEFSMQAFYNKKLDLVQSEGLGLLIDAETEKQRKLAWSLLSGDNTLLLDKLREEVISTLTLLEVLIDFPDEDIPQDILLDAENRIQILKQAIGKLLASSDAAKRIIGGITIVITGEPNVGKSSLINALTRKATSIVTDIPGTTRDVVEARIEINGVPVVIKDTAGIRESVDQVEMLGIERAKQAVKEADILIKLVDATTLSKPEHADSYDHQIPFIAIANKIDLLDESILWNIKNDPKLIPVSVKSEINLHVIWEALERHVTELSDISMDCTVVNERQYRCLEESLEALSSFALTLPLDVACEHLRRAASALDVLIGVIDPEDILDSIFGKFCIGK